MPVWKSSLVPKLIQKCSASSHAMAERGYSPTNQMPVRQLPKTYDANLAKTMTPNMFVTRGLQLVHARSAFYLAAYPV